MPIVMVEMVNVDWHWHLPWGFTAVILLIIILYGRGWRHGRDNTSKPVHHLLFCASLILLMIAWLSPLNTLASQLFSARVIQRILLVGMIPFLFLLGNGIHTLFAGLPTRTQTWATAVPSQKPHLYDRILSLTKPSVAWLFFVCCVWLWYDEKLHQLTLTYPVLHNFESLLLLSAALLYWWHILAVSPQLHDPMHPVIRILYAVIGSGPIKIVGFILLFSTQSIYNYPASIQFHGLVISDQNLGGIFIWTVGGIVFTWTAVYLTREWLSLEDDKPYLPHHHWSSQEAMLAPGFGNKNKKNR